MPALCAYSRGMTRQSKMRPVFSRLHAATLARATSIGDLATLLAEADAFPDRHRLSEGAVYTSACRRYLLETGRQWREETITTASTTWTSSDHRPRLNTDTGEWRCSCGARGTDTDPAKAHNSHVTGVTLA